MKKSISLAAAALLASTLAVPASAQDHGNSEPNGNAYGHGCVSPSVGDQATPGHYFRALRDSARFEGMNPAQIVALDSISQDKVVELLERYCDNSED